MFHRYQLTQSPRFAVYFRKLRPTETDLYFVYYWIACLGWLEIRRYNDDMLELLELATQEPEEKPMTITPGPAEPTGKE